MPSIGSFKAQPVTRTYAITGTSTAFFSEADITAWIASQGLTSVGTLVTVPNATFSTVMGNLAAATGSPYTGVRSLRDMGKEYVIGNEYNSRLLVLHKVQVPSNASDAGLDGRVIFVVTENHSLQNTDARFNVTVARA
jgi:hypothetical protein